MKDPDYRSVEDADIKVIAKRWEEYSPNDIRLYKDLPDWQVIVEDIHYLLEVRDEILKAYEDGYQDGRDERLEEEYELGYNDGLEAAKKSKE